MSSSAYEVFLRISDVFHNRGFDHTNFAAWAAPWRRASCLGLPPSQLSHCISMAVVPNVILRQVRMGHLSMFKAAASGQAGRAGVFAALLARAGMEGPHLPFEGKAGWCDHVAGKRFSLDTMGGNGTSLQDTGYADQDCGPPAATRISSDSGGRESGAAQNIKDVKQVTVEVYKYAKEPVGTGEQRWNPESRETADHSIPYVVAATLMDGTVTPRSFNDAHLWNPELRALMQKIEVVENEEFTQALRAYAAGTPRARHRRDRQRRAAGGRDGRRPGRPGGAEERRADREKFRGLTEDFWARSEWTPSSTVCGTWRI